MTTDTVRLTRKERNSLIAAGRAAGDLDSSIDAIETILFADPRWDDLDAATISDYAWAAARFCFPREAADR